MENLIWKKWNRETIDDINQYVLNYVKNVDRNVKIIVGCDSHPHRRRLIYAITVILYNESRKKGAHVVYSKVKIPRVRDVSVKIRKEAEFVYAVAESLDQTLRGTYYYKFDRNTYDNTLPTKLVEVHVDINPKKNTKNGRKFSNNLSNDVYQEVMGWLCGSGFKVFAKPDAFGSTGSADKLSKS